MSSIASGTTTTTGLIYTSDTTGNLVLQTNGTTTAVTIDTSQNATFVGSITSGNVSISGTSPLTVNTTSANQFKASLNGTLYGQWFANNAYTFGVQNAAGGTTYLGVDTNGNTLIGNPTNIGKLSVKASANAYAQGIITEQSSGTNYWSMLSTISNNLYFGYNNADKGYINSSTGAYTAISDQRLKKNIVDISYGLSAVMSLRPVSYHMNDQLDTDTKSLGFIAQEALSVVPESVSEMMSGMYGMDKQSIIPVLTKAIQELSAKVTALEAKVA